MRYLSVCSGIEAATVAWHPLGWEPAAFSEIEPFPCRLLSHHYPTVPNRGDLTRYREWPDDAIDLVVGGTPCQSFSVAGLRAGLADPRGNLALVFLGLVDRYRPRWVVWENVPGVLSSSGGRDFGAFLGGLGHLGYGYSYRVLDAQYFGVAQRRRRVFVVGYLGDWRRAAAVLLEPHSLSGDSAPRRTAGERIANAVTERPDRGGGNSEGQRLVPEISFCLNAGGMGRKDSETETMIPITHALTGTGHDASEDGSGRGTPIVPVLSIDLQQVTSKTNRTQPSVEAPPLTTHGSPVAFDTFNQSTGEQAHTIRSGAGTEGIPATVGIGGVRRLTPVECSRLQGFPDQYCRIPLSWHKERRITKTRTEDRWVQREDGKWGLLAPDGPIYKALGNSMAVPVMRWIGERIAMVDSL